MQRAYLAPGEAHRTWCRQCSDSRKNSPAHHSPSHQGSDPQGLTPFERGKITAARGAWTGYSGPMLGSGSKVCVRKGRPADALALSQVFRESWLFAYRGIIPHAHYICKKMTGWATLPNGRKRTLIRIDDWDFNWQEQYRYRQPLRLPAGTKVEMEFVYDNSAANPRNPSNPPKRVEWGSDATDEMAGLHIQVTPVRMEDLPELGRALWGKIMRGVGGFIPKR